MATGAAPFRTEEKGPLGDDGGGFQPQNVDLTTQPPAYSPSAQPQSTPQWQPTQPNPQQWYPTQQPQQIPAQPHPAGQWYQPQQPQQVVFVSPTPANPQADSPATRQKRKVVAICAVIELICALIILILGITIATSVVIGPAITLFLAFPCTLAAGILGIIAAKTGYNGTIIASLVLSIIEAAVDGAAFIFAAVMWGVYDNMYYGPYNSTLTTRSATAVFAVATVVCLVAIVAATVQASYGCALVCQCCKPHDPRSIPVQYYIQGGQPGQPVTLVPTQAVPGQPVALIPAQGQSAAMMPPQGQTYPYQTVMVAQPQTTVTVQRF